MIESNRLRFRPKKLEDAFQDYAWSQDPELARLDATWPLRMSFADYFKLYAEMVDSPDNHHFAIETKEGKHIGNCMVYNLRRGQGELGIMIGEKSCWDQGLGTEAVSLLIDYAFASLGLKGLKLHTLGWNLRARRCFEKCGFVAEGQRSWNGQPFLVMKLSRSQWQERARAKPSAAGSPPPSQA